MIRQYVPITVSIFRRRAMHPNPRVTRTRDATGSETGSVILRNNDRTPSTSSRTARMTKLREITGTQPPRLSRGRPDTGREREAAKLRDETAERNPPCARAASPEYTEAARLDQKGNPQDRLYSSSRCRNIRASSALFNPFSCVLSRPVKVQIRIVC